MATQQPVVHGRLRLIGGVGIAAATLIVIVVVLNAASAWATWHSYRVLVDYLADSTTASDLDSADDLNSNVGASYLILFVAAAVVFLFWLWRARVNTEAVTSFPHRRGRPWVIWAWICPVVSLWFPYQVVDDVYRASQQLPRGADVPRWPLGSGITTMWWASWLSCVVLDRIAVALWREAGSLELLRVAAFMQTAVSALAAAAAAMIIVIMRRVSGWQDPRVRHPAD